MPGVGAVWAPRKLGPKDRSAISGSFMDRLGRHLAYMAQCEQTRLYFDIGSEGQVAKSYIDLASAMTAANRKQYHQVSGGGEALCYRVAITALDGTFTISGLNSQYLICNSVKQTSKGWKAQMRHAGIKLKDLPAWGRRPRFGLETPQIVENPRTVLGVDDPVFEISDLNLEPKLIPGGVSSWFSTYNSTDGTDSVAVSYHASATPGPARMAANQVTQVTVTDGAGAESNVPLVMTGSSGDEFNVIREYFRARRELPSVDLGTPGPDGHSQMLNLFSVAEEMSDDIVEAVEHYMDFKPYTPETSTNSFDTLVQHCKVSSFTTGTVPAAAGVTASNHYPPVTDIIDVPLGLLKIESVALDTVFQIDVLAVYEM